MSKKQETKNSLSLKVSRELGVSEEKCNAVITAFLDELSNTLKQGGSVKLRGIFSMTVKDGTRLTYKSQFANIVLKKPYKVVSVKLATPLRNAVKSIV